LSVSPTTLRLRLSVPNSCQLQFSVGCFICKFSIFAFCQNPCSRTAGKFRRVPQPVLSLKLNPPLARSSASSHCCGVPSIAYRALVASQYCGCHLAVPVDDRGNATFVCKDIARSEVSVRKFEEICPCVGLYDDIAVFMIPRSSVRSGGNHRESRTAQ
jgi:hypothetical protein